VFPLTDIRRPLEGERQHAVLHAADDPGGGPVAGRRPPLTGASPPQSIGVPPIYRGFPTCTPAESPRSKHSKPLNSTGQTPRHTLPRTVWNCPCKSPWNICSIEGGSVGGALERGANARGWVLSDGPREARRRRDGSCAEGWPGSFALPATLPQTGPEEIVTIDKYRVPEMDQSKTKEAKGERFKVDVQ
jgi:hypothetical protein